MSNARMYHDDGMKKYNRGAHSEASASFQKALAAYQDDGKPDMVAEMRANLGMIAREQKRFDDAQNLLRDALATFEELGDAKRSAMVKANLGGVLSSMGDKEAAYDLYVQAADVFQELGETQMQGETLKTLAALQIKRGKLMQGGEILTDAVGMVDSSTFGERLLKAAVNIFTFRWVGSLRQLTRR